MVNLITHFQQKQVFLEGDTLKKKNEIIEHWTVIGWDIKHHVSQFLPYTQHVSSNAA